MEDDGNRVFPLRRLKLVAAKRSGERVRVDHPIEHMAHSVGRRASRGDWTKARGTRAKLGQIRSLRHGL